MSTRAARFAHASRSLTRRSFLRDGSLFLAGSATAWAWAAREAAADPTVRPAASIGLFTDVHYANKPVAGSRHYRDSLAKVRSAIDAFNHEPVDLVIHCGDLIDSAGGSVEAEIEFLKTIEAELARIEAPRHYILGNHCVHVLSKQEFIEHTAARKPFYSFDHAGHHIIILDACFNEKGESYQRENFHWQDANIPPHELDWLRQDLRCNDLPTIVFVHQRLDETEHYSVRNAPAVRELLESSCRVVLVIQGHSHRNQHQRIRGIDYIVLRAVVEGAGQENSAHARLLAYPDGSLQIKGFIRQESYQLGSESR